MLHRKKYHFIIIYTIPLVTSSGFVQLNTWILKSRKNGTFMYISRRSLPGATFIFCMQIFILFNLISDKKSNFSVTYTFHHIFEQLWQQKSAATETKDENSETYSCHCNIVPPVQKTWHIHFATSYHEYIQKSSLNHNLLKMNYWKSVNQLWEL